MEIQFWAIHLFNLGLSNTDMESSSASKIRNFSEVQKTLKFFRKKSIHVKTFQKLKEPKLKNGVFWLNVVETAESLAVEYWDFPLYSFVINVNQYTIRTSAWGNFVYFRMQCAKLVDVKLQSDKITLNRSESARNVRSKKPSICMKKSLVLGNLVGYGPNRSQN